MDHNDQRSCTALSSVDGPAFPPAVTSTGKGFSALVCPVSVPCFLLTSDSGAPTGNVFT